MRNLIILIFFYCIACQSPAVFEKYEALPDETWNRYRVVEFTAHIPDSGLYHIDLCLRHTTDYEMANLWCLVSTRNAQGVVLKDTVNIKIAEADGRWLGEGGTIKTIQHAINHNPVALPEGDITFRIEQGMRIEDMQGIKNVGIKIERIKPNGANKNS